MLKITHFLITISLVHACFPSAAQKRIKVPSIEGDYVNIYKPKGDIFPGPSTSELEAGKYYDTWVPNDHCFIKSDNGTWHIFGITHPITSLKDMHQGEFLSFHAVAPKGSFKKSLKAGVWKDEPKVLTPAQRPGDSSFFYAPTPVKKDGLTYMIWAPGSPFNYATSKDLYNWKYNGRLRNTPENRDPNVLYFEGTYYMVTCGNNKINIATSKDLINWESHKPILSRNDPVSFESPYLVRYNNTFYIFTCLWDYRKWDEKSSLSVAYQHITQVYQSDDIFNFNSKPITEIEAHAGEIIQDEDGNWYISSAEWPNRGISIAKLIWK